MAPESQESFCKRKKEIKDPDQLEIDFSEKSFEEERKEVAKKFGVGDPNLMRKEKNQWYVLFFGDYITIEEWKDKMDKLYDPNTDSHISDPYPYRKKR